MSRARKDQEAEAAAKAVVMRLFGEEAIESIQVTSTEDYSGEKGLSVTIYLREYKARVGGDRLLDAIVAISNALREIDDDRFPYVTFLAPGYEHAEDDEWQGADGRPEQVAFGGKSEPTNRPCQAYPNS